MGDAAAASHSMPIPSSHAHARPSHNTQDNTREEWKEHYVDYKALKKLLKPLKGAKGKAWLKKGGAGGGGEASDSGGWEGGIGLMGMGAL